MSKAEILTDDVALWLADWDVEAVCPALAKVMLHIEAMRKRRKDIFFTARRRDGRDKDAMPASFFRSTLPANLDGKRPVDWVFGVSHRNEWWGNGRFGGREVFGPIIQLNTHWKEIDNGHKFTSFYKAHFISRSDLPQAPELLMKAGITQEWPTNDSWRRWTKYGEIVVFAKAFQNLYKHMAKTIQLIDSIPKGRA